jgi:hypothetical protein
MRAKDDAFLSAVDLRNELDIPEHVFAETLETFRHGEQSAVEVFESNGETILDWANQVDITATTI